MAIQQRSQIKGFGQSTNEKYLVLDVNDVITELNTLPDPLKPNPTDQYIPYNDNGVFADSPLRRDAATSTVYSNYDLNISRTSAEGIPQLGLYQNADGGFGFVDGGSAIQWGFDNQDPMLGPESAKDCSIKNLPGPAGLFGSGIGIFTQKTLQFVPADIDTQELGLDVRPWSFMNATGGVTVYGGGANGFQSSYFNVIGDDGFPPFPKMDFACARFDGQMTAIVVPRVPAANQGMMSGENGMILYNTDTNKFQGYANGVWVDLH
jgi:hypothetical protein